MKLEMLDNLDEKVFTVIEDEAGSLKFDRCCVCGESIIGDYRLVYMCNPCWQRASPEQKRDAQTYRDILYLNQKIAIFYKER